MALTRIRCDWAKVPLQARRCGPQEYAQSLLDELQAARETEFGAWLTCPCSEAGVRQIVELAYYASQMEEEGRALRFAMVFGVEDGDNLPLPLVARFRYPVPIGDVSDLVRIAPAFGHRRCALWIAERQGADGEPQLECLGLLNADVDSQRLMVGYPDPIVTGSRTVLNQQAFLKLTVAGSGHLRASFGLLWEYTLRSGIVRPTLSYAMAPPLAAHFHETEQILRRRFARRYPDLPLPEYVLQNSREITHLWTRILEQTVSAEHGGTFLVVPEDSVRLAAICNHYHVSDGMLVDLDLGVLLVEFSAACAELALHKQAMAAGSSQHAIDRLVELQQNWFARRNALHVGIETAAGLADVDGCVVLDRGLRVHLFGGKIRNARTDSPMAARLFDVRDWYERPQSLLPSVGKLGTRNQSACGFCREHPRSLAFVVSQDTDLRVYASDTEYAYAFESLAPC